MRKTGRTFPQFSENRQLLAVDDGEVSQFESQLRNAFDATGFLSGGDIAENGFAAARDDPAVHDALLFVGN